MQRDYLRVRKEELPIPLIVEDNGQVMILSLEPAGKKKLGARIGSASKEAVDKVKRFLKLM